MINVLELFGGIGACTKALKRSGIDFDIADYVEIDKYAVKSYNAINGTNFTPQDIRKWDKDINVDLIMHGSPCQDFSLAGKQRGADEGSGTRSSLMYETIRIVEKLKPKYVIWENVKNVLSQKHIHNFNKYLNYMESFGYRNYYKVLNSKDYGIPQNRKRIFVVSILGDEMFMFPKTIKLDKKLKDLLEDKVDEKYYLSDEQLSKGYLGNAVHKNLKDYFNRENCLINKEIAYTITTKPDRRIGDCNFVTDDKVEMTVKQFLEIKENTKKGYKEAYIGDSVNLDYPTSKTRRGRVGNQVANTLTTSCNQGVVSNDLRLRKLTPLESWRLMGFDDEDFYKAEKINSNTQLYKQAGNSIVVNVLEEILKNIFLCENEYSCYVQTTIFDYK